MDIRDIPNSNVGKIILRGIYLGVGVAIPIILNSNITGSIAGIKATHILLVMVVLVALIGLIWEYFGHKYSEKKHQQQVYDQIGAQISLMTKSLSYDNDTDIRSTYHIPIEIDGEERLYQAIDYRPTGGGKGRDFSPNEGIIGNSYQNFQTLTENFQDSEEYRTKMVEEYGYDEDEMGIRTTDRRSYFCRPVIEEQDEGRVIGLVYIDSDECGTFPEDIEQARDRGDRNIELILNTCQSIKNTHLMFE
jgi:hypothetical protein